MEWLKKIKALFATHAAKILCCVVGVFVGLFLKMPLIHSQLSESAATVIGSGLGALGAVAGAYLVADLIVNREDQSMRATIAAILKPIPPIIVELQEALEMHREARDIWLKSDGDAYELFNKRARSKSSVDECRWEVERAANRLRLTSDAAQRLRAQGAIAYADTVHAIEDYRLTLEKYGKGNHPDEDHLNAFILSNAIFWGQLKAVFRQLELPFPSAVEDITLIRLPLPIGTSGAGDMRAQQLSDATGQV
jgi:hypothetical protein